MGKDAKFRGADLVATTLKRLGVRYIFTLSGNHIMSLFDAALETKLELIHTRHEAAAYTSWMHRYFFPPRCLTCTDLTAQLADEKPRAAAKTADLAPVG